VAAAAEDAAVEHEGSRTVGHDPHPRDGAGLDLRVDFQLGQREAMAAIDGGELEHHRNSDLELDQRGGELEFLRRDPDDLLGVGRRQERRGEEEGGHR
jgi:hypothetical protein